MPDAVYEVVAQGARYWFLFLMFMIAWRSWRWYRKDRRQAKKRRRLLPDAGFVGEMVVIDGGGAVPNGTVLSLPREGTMGASRTNDLSIPAAGMAKRHLWFRFDDNAGLMVEPFGHNDCNVDGADFQSRRDPLYMAHGSRLYAGGIELRLRLFAGFESTGYAPRRPEEESEEESPVPQAAQAYPDPAMLQQMEALQRQQQWLMEQYAVQQEAYRMGYEQAMAEQERQEPGMEAADPYSYEAARVQGRIDRSAFMRPTSQPAPRLPAEEPEPIPDEPVHEASFETAFETDEPFFPPVMDEAYDDEEAVSGVWDEDLTDAAAPPRSAYIGHDESERAKRQVWDRYFGGRQGR